MSVIPVPRDTPDMIPLGNTSLGKITAFSHPRGEGASRGRLLRFRMAELIARCGGLVKAAAKCRVGKSTLARYASTSPADAECYAPIDVVHDLERVAGEAIVTGELCSLAGGSFVAFPDAVPTGQDLLVQLAIQGKEHSDLATAILTGLDGGRLTRANAEAALIEQEEVLRVGALMRAELLAIIERHQ